MFIVRGNAYKFWNRSFVLFTRFWYALANRDSCATIGPVINSVFLFKRTELVDFFFRRHTTESTKFSSWRKEIERGRVIHEHTFSAQRGPCPGGVGLCPGVPCLVGLCPGRWGEGLCPRALYWETSTVDKQAVCILENVFLYTCKIWTMKLFVNRGQIRILNRKTADLD